VLTSYALFVEPGPVMIVALRSSRSRFRARCFLVADLSQPFVGLMQIRKLRNTLAPIN